MKHFSSVRVSGFCNFSVGCFWIEFYDVIHAPLISKRGLSLSSLCWSLQAHETLEVNDKCYSASKYACIITADSKHCYDLSGLISAVGVTDIYSRQYVPEKEFLTPDLPHQ